MLQSDTNKRAFIEGPILAFHPTSGVADWRIKKSSRFYYNFFTRSVPAFILGKGMIYLSLFSERNKLRHQNRPLCVPSPTFTVLMEKNLRPEMKSRNLLSVFHGDPLEVRGCRLYRCKF